MLQIAVEQTFSAPVNDVPEIWAVVFAGLDGQRTVVCARSPARKATR